MYKPSEVTSNSADKALQSRISYLDLYWSAKKVALDPPFEVMDSDTHMINETSDNSEKRGETGDNIDDTDSDAF